MGRIPTLAVNEIFGPTFQGEGVHLGMPCMFLRLAGCNLACSWCDTPYAWDWSRYNSREEMHPMTVDQVYGRLSQSPIKNLVISGGEPMLQQKVLYDLTERLHKEGWHTEIETAGTIVPGSTELVSHWTCSPKLKNSNNAKYKRLNGAALHKINLAPSKCFKFVASSVGDLEEIDSMVERFGLWPVYIMPEGVDKTAVDTHLQEIAHETIKRGYSLTTRLHITLYGSKRGI